MIKLSQLSLFCAVVEEGTVNAAAQKSNCVPSNITVRMKELESTLGAELFVRERSRLRVSPEGRALYWKAREMLSLANDTMALFEAEETRAILNVGALEAALSNQLPERIAEFRKKMPNVVVNVRPGHSFDLERRLVDGELDVIVTDGPIQHPLLTSELAFHESLRFITPSDIRDLNLDRLNVLELYVFGLSCFYRQQVEAWIKRVGIKPRLVMEIESYPVMFACVSSGLGMACVPASFHEHAAGMTGCYMHNVGEHMRSDLYLVWRRDQKSKVIQIFKGVVTGIH